MRNMIIAAFVFAPAAVCAEFLSGNDLLQRIESSDSVNRSIALGYVMGVHDALRSVTHCSPTTTTSGQVHDMVHVFLITNPQHRHASGDSIISHVLTARWPCEQRKGGQQIRRI